jgi:hypothetical protein
MTTLTEYASFFATDPANITAELCAIPAIYARELFLLAEAKVAHKNAKWQLARVQARVEQFVRDTHALDTKKPTEGAIAVECSMHPDVQAADSVLRAAESAYDDKTLLIEALSVKKDIVLALAKYLASEAISSRNTTA